MQLLKKQRTAERKSEVKILPREWNHPIRENWNAPIHQILKAIDNHNREYFETGNSWHLEKADMLRNYLKELKTWIHKKEHRK